MWDGTASPWMGDRGCWRGFRQAHMCTLLTRTARRCAATRWQHAPTRSRLRRWRSGATCSECSFIPRSRAMSACRSWRTSVHCESLAKRIIACLDVNGGRVVKGIQFEQIRDAGDPAELAAAHSAAGADEIVLLDITATAESRNTLLETVSRTAKQLFIPFTVGGGIRTLDDAAAVLDCGADKVAMNSAAIADPELITRVAERYGSQAVVVAIDARQSAPTAWEVYVWGGRKPTGRDANEWAIAAEKLGAGEILLTSMDRDGTKSGFDCPLTRSIATRVRIPVIASGGAGQPHHFVEVFEKGAADAALAASVFHFGLKSVETIKLALRDAGIPVRLTC